MFHHKIKNKSQYSRLLIFLHYWS